MKVTYTIDGTSTRLSSRMFSYALTHHDMHEPQKVTFLHPAGIVSYGILRPPSRKAITTIRPGQNLPVHLNLHGAGLESDSDQVRHMLDSVPNLRAFVLFPTGVTPWSSDDWHDWGFADVKAAVAFIPKWIEQVNWQGPHADLERWFVSGHSNGGQGTLYALTHHPDKIIGAAPVSGYTSIQKYVPYLMWNEADSQVMHMVETSMQSFRLELLVENFKGVPILQQHGDEDENVPAFHSRRLYQLTLQAGQAKSRHYAELAGKGHWYEGVMTTPALRAFYARCLADEARRPALPQQFQTVVANPADMGCRGGVQVDQLMSPNQLGKFHVKVDAASKTVHCETSNIRRFHFVAESPLIAHSTELVVDGTKIPELPQIRSKLDVKGTACWLLLKDGSWKVSCVPICPGAADCCSQVSEDTQWLLEERHSHQLGPLQSILRTRGNFCIQCLTTEGTDVALQISRNLYQYYGADSEIVGGASHTIARSGNVITVSLGTHKLPKPLEDHPFEIDRDCGIFLCKRDGATRRYALQDGLGTIFLRPLATQRLELIVWGFDATGLRQAARLLPMLTGVGQPDFVVVRKTMAWEGAAGALAMGSFDSAWQISDASFLQ